MRYLVVLCGLWMMSILSASAQSREFTNLKGKKVTAKPIGKAAGKFVFEKADGTKFAYGLHELIPEDQAYLKEWAENAGAPLEVSEAKVVLVGKRRTTSSGQGKSSEESRAYQVNLKNRSDQPIAGLVCCYALFPKRIDRNATNRRNNLEPVYGKVTFEPISKSGQVTFQTKGATLTSMNLKTASSNLQWEESLAGANFHFFVGQKRVLTHHIGDFKDEGTPSPEDLEEDPKKADDNHRSLRSDVDQADKPIAPED